jgi:hypothetical protein
MTISSENPENYVNLTEENTDVSRSGETVDTLGTDKLDGLVMQDEVLTLEPTQPIKSAEDDVGEGLEPGRAIHTPLNSVHDILLHLLIIQDWKSLASYHQF